MGQKDQKDQELMGQPFERVRSTDKAATRVSLQGIWSEDPGDNYIVV